MLSLGSLEPACGHESTIRLVNGFQTWKCETIEEWESGACSIWWPGRTDKKGTYANGPTGVLGKLMISAYFYKEMGG